MNSAATMETLDCKPVKRGVASRRASQVAKSIKIVPPHACKLSRAHQRALPQPIAQLDDCQRTAVCALLRRLHGGQARKAAVVSSRALLHQH
eukprot:4113901-Pleurochrysis_carterae.AAC.9